MRVVDAGGDEVPQGEAGEIQIRGHNLMKGYWNLPDATLAAISAAVLLKDGAGATADELRDFVKARVAAYK